MYLVQEHAKGVVHVDAIHEEVGRDKQEDATVITQQQQQTKHPILLVHPINYQKKGRKPTRKTAIHYVELGNVDNVRRLVEPGRDLSKECQICHDYDVHHGWIDAISRSRAQTSDTYINIIN